MTCQCALQNDRKYTIQQHLRSFHVNSEIEYDSKYKTGFFGADVNVCPNFVLVQMIANAMEIFFSEKLAMICVKGLVLRLHKLLVNVIYDSCMSKTS